MRIAMPRKTHLALATAVAGLLLSALAQSASADNISLKSSPPPVTPADKTPVRMGGMVFFVNDLEAQRIWYENVLGMKVVRTYERDGKLFEYIMAYEDQNQVLALMLDRRPAGAQSVARLLLRVPDPKALADHLYANGIAVRCSSPMSCVMTDPEGNSIEISNPRPRPGADPVVR